MLEKILPEDENQVLRKAKTQQVLNTGKQQINVLALLCLLRGEVCEALESRELAAAWYQLALRCDVHCSDVRLPNCISNSSS